MVILKLSDYGTPEEKLAQAFANLEATAKRIRKNDKNRIAIERATKAMQNFAVAIGRLNIDWDAECVKLAMYQERRLPRRR